MFIFREFLLITTLTVSIYANEYALVVSKKSSISELSKQQIKKIFLKKRYYVGDQKVLPVNLTSNMELRIHFEEKVLNMDRKKLNSFWTKQHFQGVSPPSTQSSINSLKLFVQNVDGAIGYLPKNLIDNSVKVIYEF